MIELEILKALGIDPPPGYVELYERGRRVGDACMDAKAKGARTGLVAELYATGDPDLAERIAALIPEKIQALNLVFDRHAPASHPPILWPDVPLGPACPECGAPCSSITVEVEPKARRLCEPPSFPERKPGERWKQYLPCGHWVQA